jgi:hypothetical protein
MEMNEERIKRCLEEIGRTALNAEVTARDIECARRAVERTAADQKAGQGTSLRVLLRSKGLRIAAVLCVGLCLALWLGDAGVKIDGASAAFARVMEALERPRMMYEVLDTKRDDGEAHRSEWWYDFDSRTLLARYARNGQCWKISRLDYGTMENVVYHPDINEVRIVYRCDMGPDGYPATAGEVASAELERRISRGAKVERERARHGDMEVDVYRSTIERNEHKDREVSTLVVDRGTNLPVSMETKEWSKQGELVFDQTIRFEFPSAGPQDIYAIGAPRSAPIVPDVASRQRYDLKLALEQQIPHLEKEFERALEEAYRLPDGQVLAWIPPALAEPRLKLQRARDEVRRLVDEQVRERSAPLRPADEVRRGRTIQSSPPESELYYLCFTWNDGIDMERSRPAFRGSTSLQAAVDRIVGLSKFEYEIAEDLKDLSIPGDWVLRKGSPRELRVAALERIVQESTGRPIVFRRREVERDVIVARGTFRFQPLSGTYDESWIHVYADRLDPDERSGGGGGSLEKFIRYLGEVNFNQQVVDETQSDREIQVSYGWHKSGYVRLIADEKERAQKRQMVLDNVSRQTGLTFRIEHRMVCTWIVTEDRS